MSTTSTPTSAELLERSGALVADAKALTQLSPNGGPQSQSQSEGDDAAAAAAAAAAAEAEAQPEPEVKDRIAVLEQELADLEAADPKDEAAIAAKKAELEALKPAVGGRRRSKRRKSKKGGARKSKKSGARKSKKNGRSRKNGSKRRAQRKH